MHTNPRSSLPNIFGESSAYLAHPALPAHHNIPFQWTDSVMRGGQKAFGQKADLINSQASPSAIYQEPLARRQVTNKSPPVSLSLWASE